MIGYDDDNDYDMVVKKKEMMMIIIMMMMMIVIVMTLPQVFEDHLERRRTQAILILPTRNYHAKIYSHLC